MFEDKNKLENLYHLALVLTQIIGLGSNKSHSEARRLLTQYGNFEEIYKAYVRVPLDDLVSLNNDVTYAKKRLEKLGFEFRTLTINDSEFPAHLKQNSEATPVIYTRGDLGLFNMKSMGVIGTRRLEDDVDIEEGKKIIQRLVKRDYAITSGLALGCDTLGHENAISSGGKTIAVIGTPLDKSYPSENRDLSEDIAREHLIVSQYPIGIRTMKYHFAQRNKTLVSLATDGVVVIRADDQSGTIHAVKECVKQGKQLYVLENNFGKGYEWVEKLKDKIKVPNKSGR